MYKLQVQGTWQHDSRWYACFLWQRLPTRDVCFMCGEDTLLPSCIDGNMNQCILNSVERFLYQTGHQIKMQSVYAFCSNGLIVVTSTLGRVSIGHI